MRITSLKKSHIQEIIDLSDTAFGQGYLTIDYLKKYINSSKKSGFVTLSESNKLIGFILLESLSIKNFSNQVLEEKEWFNTYFQGYKNITLIHQIAVNSSFQKQGIATNLLNHFRNQTTVNLELICCFAWVKENFTPFKKILLKDGFLFIKKINNYWLKDSSSKKYNCSYCGAPPCKCSAEIFIKK
ncbi:MAG: hypothetical protein CO118_03260 [Flavobacteriales bacterium CG_4_9_14_3_um_filter_32_8]|nr:MAG: hypothetical protein CO118_03260 [Flavobacteriales bacterium CG_4_9_14_3_um_filter_32_8]